MPQLFETPISTSNLYAPNLDRICALIDQVVDDDGAIITGSLVTKLEEKLCEYHQARYCVTFSTGFWALVAAVRIRSLPKRSEVIIPSLTYRRLADVVYWAGKVPRFVDVEPDHLAVCPDAVEDAISDETSLILAVHPIVNCCDVERLLSISDQRSVPVVFDAVESVHETIDRKRVGSFGVGEVFSLHASKLINGMEGGYVCTSDRDFAASLAEFRAGGMPFHHGASNRHDHDFLGLNGVLNDGHAALALASLEEIDANVQHNKTIYQRYLHELRKIDGIDIVRFRDEQQTSYKNVVAAVTDEFPIDRDRLVQLLNAQGILARAYYTPALHEKSYDYVVESTRMRATPQVAARYINLPCGQRVAPDDVAVVCQYTNSIAINDGSCDAWQRPQTPTATSTATPTAMPAATVRRRNSVVAEDVKDIFRCVYRNRYFTNHGPMAKEFEALLEEYLDIKNVVTVGNESLALLIAVAGLSIIGEIVVPAYRATIASRVAAWLGLRTAYCDVDPISHQVSVESLRPALTNNTEAVVLVETWGNRCDKQLVEFLTSRKLKVVIIAFDSFGSQADQRYVFNDPNVTTVHSFGPNQLLTTLQGGSVATNNDELAHRFRNIRSSYGVRDTRRVKATCNGRFSELQAGIGMKSFAGLEQRRAHFQTLARSYRSALAGCDDIAIYECHHTQVANGQFFPIRIKETFPVSRDDLIVKLGLDGATVSGGGRVNGAKRNGSLESHSFPVAHQLNSQVLQLPVSSNLSAEAPTQVANKIERIT